MFPSQLVLYISGYAPADQPGIHACTFEDATDELAVGGSFAGIVTLPMCLSTQTGAGCMR
jgi:hypothetical protein